jgi:hydrogenase maturation protease
VPAAPTDARVVVGGVGHLYQGDLDFGRVAVERLAHDDLGEDVVVEEFSYGAVAVAQRLQELAPEALVLIGATSRGRRPGTVERREVAILPRSPEEIQSAIVDAVTGYIDLDLVLEVAQGLEALPPHVVTIEVEPARTEPSAWLSPEAERGVLEAIALVRAEVDRFGQATSSSSPRF